MWHVTKLRACDEIALLSMYIVGPRRVRFECTARLQRISSVSITRLLCVCCAFAVWRLCAFCAFTACSLSGYCVLSVRFLRIYCVVAVFALVFCGFARIYFAVTARFPWIHRYALSISCVYDASFWRVYCVCSAVTAGLLFDYGVFTGCILRVHSVATVC